MSTPRPSQPSSNGDPATPGPPLASSSRRRRPRRSRANASPRGDEPALAAEAIPDPTSEAASYVLRYPGHLPVVEAKDEILEAIRDHQVVIVAGETGSGKTPKFCLELGRGRAGAIGHTQPRRIAARSVAERLAEELESPLGETVGYQVRFVDESSKKTRVRVMTDGILLSQMQRDRDLRQYDTLIIDEAHERSLNTVSYTHLTLPTILRV